MKKSKIQNPKSKILSLLLASCLGVLMFATGLRADSLAFSKTGTTAAAFLKISVGRATGMGDAFTAIADDPSAAWYNPAGLALVGKREVFANHVAWVVGTSHEYLTGVLPVSGIGNFAISITSFNSGDIEMTQIDDPATQTREDQGTGLFYSSSDMAIGLSYSRLITEKLAFGFTAKSITEGIWNMSASGIGADVGLIYNTGWRSLRLGAAVSNFGTDLSFSGLGLDFTDSSKAVKPPAGYQTNPAPLPIIFRFGAAYDFIHDTTNRLTADIDLVHPSDINETVNFGLEYALARHYFIRAGYILNTDVAYSSGVTGVGWDQGLSAGAGLKFTPVNGLDMTLDYAYRNQGYLGSTHHFTLSVAF